jgi:chemotaxis protein methyltransferase CheR
VRGGEGGTGAAPNEPDEIEFRLLLEAVYLRYGYDFRRYASRSLRRRLDRAMEERGLANLAELQHRVLRERSLFVSLLDALTVNVTDMFRDPPFYAALRRVVLPFLRTYPALKLWIAGCATGEESDSLAILLHEEGLGDRSRIYATDINPAALARAREGIYPIDRLELYADNYRRAGGTADFTSYFTVAHGYAAISPSLRQNVHFAEHNLASDEVFGQMHLVFCRNVLIYFERGLQDRVVDLLGRSLVNRGFLCLGAREHLHLSGHADAYDELAPGSKIFRRRPAPIDSAYRVQDRVA